MLILVIGWELRYIYADVLLEKEMLEGFFLLSSLGLGEFVFMLVAAFLVTLLLPRKLERPTDFALLVYIVLLLIPKTFLINLYAEWSLMHNISLFAILFLPICLIFFVMRFKFPRFRQPNMPLFRGKGYKMQIRLGMLAYAGLVFLLFREYISFDFAPHYDRRFLLRDYLSGNLVLRYLTTVFAGGIIPFTAFYATVKRSVFLLALSVFSAILIFGITGEKFPTMLLLCSVGLGLYLVNEKKLSRHAVTLFLFVFAGFIALIILGDYFFQINILADLVFRRLLVVPTHINEVYFAFLLSEGQQTTLTTKGDVSITYLIGEIFFGDPALNANTNFIMVALAAGGFPSLLAAMLFIIVWLKFVDQNYLRTKNINWVWIGFVIGLVSFEQRIFSLFLTSGIGLITIALYFSSVLENRRPSARPRQIKG